MRQRRLTLRISNGSGRGMQERVMVAYSFQQRFVTPIRRLTKQQTIRADRKRHARIGEELQLYTGMRTRQCKLIGRATCMSVTPITLEFGRGNGDGKICYDGIVFRSRDNLDQFAQLDGFDDWGGLVYFWEVNHPDMRVFSGIMIRWGGFVT
jgi:hypothetical protein